MKAEAILLVDDDDLFVRSTTRLLRGLGYPFVFRATSGAEALDMLARVRPTFVLTDMAMEHRAAGREVAMACRALGIDVAIVSGMPGLDADVLGCRVFRKSELCGGGALETLLASMVEANQRRSRESVLPPVSVMELRRVAAG
jgi:CheY-like chemotaxis protein